MGRKRRKDGLADVLIVLPWWVSVSLGIMGFVVMRWLIPSAFAEHSILKLFAPTSHSMAWLPLVLFGFTGLIAYVRIHRANADQPKPVKELNKRRMKVGSKESSSGLPDGQGDSSGANAARPTVSLSPDQVQSGAFPLESGDQDTIVMSLEEWSLEALRKLEWKRFELLCAKYYEIVGFKSETIQCGADGGVDVKLFKNDPDKPLAVVQCKAWNAAPVGVKEVRELLGVMAHQKVTRGVFITTGSYTRDALEFGAANPIQLLDGPGFLKKIQELASNRQADLLRFAFEGDFSTPTCASCGIKMVRRSGPRGAFWGCQNYPRCKSTFVLKN